MMHPHHAYPLYSSGPLFSVAGELGSAPHRNVVDDMSMFVQDKLVECALRWCRHAHEPPRKGTIGQLA